MNNKTSLSRDPIWNVIYVLLIILSIVVGTFLYLGKHIQDRKKTVSIYDNPQPPAATFTPSPLDKSVDLIGYSVKVLNGNGIQGDAARASKILEDEGFEVEKPYNADKATYEETVIQTSKGIPKLFIGRLKTTLEKFYVVGELQEEIITNNSQIIVIIGRKKVF